MKEFSLIGFLERPRRRLAFDAEQGLRRRVCLSVYYHRLDIEGKWLTDIELAMLSVHGREYPS